MPKGDNLRGGKVRPKVSKPRTNDAEMSKRVVQVGKLLVQGYQRFEIIGIIGGEYDVSEATVDRYIKEASLRISKKNDEVLGKTIEDKIALSEARFLDIYQGARREKKRDACIRSEQAKNDLIGINAAKKIDLTGTLKIDDIVDGGSEKIRQYLGKRK